VTERAPLSRKLSAIAESATLKVDAKAKALKAEGKPVISYAAGEPDFATPQFIVDAAAEALRDPANFRYTPAAGSRSSAKRSPRRRCATRASTSPPRR
jgi:aspartate aminotransferase